MQLFADRFVRSPGAGTLDLATNRPVVVRQLRAGSRALQARWESRCAAQACLRRPRWPELLDYGVVDSVGRYEAWSPYAGSLEGAGASRTAVRLQSRRALHVLGEMLENGRPGLRGITVCGPSGSGLSTTMVLFARVARLHGYVPVCLPALRQREELFPELAGAHVVLIDDRALRKHADGLDDFLSWLVLRLGSSSARPHLLVRAARDAEDRRAIALDRMSPAALATIVGLEPREPHCWPGDVRRAIRMSDGWPGHFLAALRHPMGTSSDARANGCVRVMKVGEARAAYPTCTSSPAAASPACGRTRGLEPIPRAVRTAAEDRLAARLCRVSQLQNRGRHAAAERLLRQVLAAARRQRLHACAASAAVRLGRLLAGRGRLSDALAALEAVSHVTWSEGPTGILDATVAIGSTLTDLGRLAESEAALRSAVVAASSADDLALRAKVEQQLARCLFWAGREDEAEQVLMAGNTASPCESAQGAGNVSGGGFTDDIRVARLALLTRIALARSDHPAAGRHASAALELACADVPSDMAAAHEAMALVQAAVGHLDAASAHVRSGLAAARAAHEPFTAIGLRLVMLDVLKASGRWGDARSLAVRLRRTSLAHIPPLLRARVQLALASCDPESAAAGTAARAFARASGASGIISRRREGHTMDVLHDVIDMLHLCQDADDEPAVLSRVCARVRERLHASATLVCAGAESSAPVSIAGPKAERTPAVARRAIETGLLIPPAVGADGVEAAAPVRYGGSTIGALACRWSMDAVPDAVRAGALLTGAAAVCAPSLRSALDRLAAPTPLPSQRHALLGVSAAMDEVRRAVVRAAGAPFPVLIEGASGP